MFSDQSSGVRLCMQDYKSLTVAVMICATLVNTQTHRLIMKTDRFWPVILSQQH